MKPPPQVIRPTGFNVGLTPEGFHRYASGFLEVCKNIQQPTVFSPVRYYLVGHSLELAIKAFLLVKRVPIDEIRSKKLGHDLDAILTRAQNEGFASFISISTTEEDELKKENSYYAEKGFEYFEPENALKGYSALPDVAVLIALCERILTAVHPLCKSFKP